MCLVVVSSTVVVVAVMMNVWLHGLLSLYIFVGVSDDSLNNVVR